MSDEFPREPAVAGNMVGVGLAIYDILYLAVRLRLFTPFLSFRRHHRRIDDHNPLTGNYEAGVAPPEICLDTYIIRYFLHHTPFILIILNVRTKRKTLV